MKNNIMKLMGIVLTLAILAGLLMTAVPVAAADLNWSNVTIPNTTNNQITLGTSITAFDVAPDGKTMFAWDNSAAPTGKKLYKSVDGGVTWTTTGVGNSLSATSTFTTPVAALGLTQIAVSPQYASDTNLVATDGATLFRSVNGGTDWFAVTVTTPSGWDQHINSVDVSTYYNGGGPAILVGYGGAAGGAVNDGGVALYVTYQGTWSFFGMNSTTPQNFVTGDVLAVAFSPTYQNDSAIFALTQNVTMTEIQGRVAGNTWNNDITPAELKLSGTSSLAGSNTAIAKMAFPSDFDYTSTSTNKIFVGIYAMGLGGLDVYRVRMGSTGSPQVTNTGSPTGSVISSLAYTGTASTGTLVVGDVGGGINNSTDVVSASTATWNGANTPPLLSTTVPTSPILVYAATSTASAPMLFCATAGNRSAFYTSTDSSVFYAQSLISIPNATAVTFPQFNIRGKTWFLEMQCDENSAATLGQHPLDFWVFKSTDSGATWKVIFTYKTTDADKIGTVNTDGQFDTDQTIYITSTYQQLGVYGTANKVATIYKSSDAGATWTHYSAPGNIPAIVSFVMVDANNYYVSGTNGDIYKNGTYTAISVNGAIVKLNNPYNPTFFTAVSTAGAVYFSADGGATWTKFGNGSEFINTTTNTAFTYDIPNKTIYAAQQATSVGGGNAPFTTTNASTLLKWVVGTSTSWETVKAMTLASGAALNSVGYISLVNGVLYAKGVDTLSSATGVSSDLFFRAVNLISDPTNLVFEAFPGVTYVPAGIGGSVASGFGNLGGPPSISIVGGTGANTLYLATTDPSFSSATAGSGVNGYSAKVSVYGDSVINGPATVAPAANAQVGGNADFSWKPATTVTTPHYDVQIAFDSGFTSLYIPTGYTSANFINLNSTVLANVPMVAGKQLYWRVRVSPGQPLTSQWSAGIAFTTATTSVATQGLDQNRGPSSGAINVGLTPVITWGSVSNATYDFKLSTDPTFATTVDTKTGLVGTVYSPAAALKANTNYFWEVRAVSNGIAGDWVTSAFTTGSGNITPPTTTGPATSVAPPVQPTIIVTIPPNTVPVTPPTTPAYIWVIIAIGAVLVIAVIVLIARTRRV